MEYEFTVVLDLSVDSHIASSTKDRTGIFDGQYLTPSEETGKRLLAWLNSGADPKVELLQQIESLIRQLNLGDLQSAYWLYAGNQYQATSVDQLDLSHLQEQLALLTQCRQNPLKLDDFQKLLAEVVRQQNGITHSLNANWFLTYAGASPRWCRFGLSQRWVWKHTNRCLGIQSGTIHRSILPNAPCVIDALVITES